VPAGRMRGRGSAGHSILKPHPGALASRLVARPSGHRHAPRANACFCPTGTPENSPVIHRRVTPQKTKPVPAGRLSQNLFPGMFPRPVMTSRHRVVVKMPFPWSACPPRTQTRPIRRAHDAACKRQNFVAADIRRFKSNARRCHHRTGSGWTYTAIGALLKIFYLPTAQFLPGESASNSAVAVGEPASAALVK